VKPIAKQSNEKRAFTIVELLTVMSIIIILMGLLAPVMNKVRRYAWKVSQKNQFHSINLALELFRAEFDGYPDSGPTDTATPPQSYCGAMKLAEAMVGQDLLGFHPDSRFRADGFDGSPPPGPIQLYDPATEQERKGYVYLPLEKANTHRLNEIYTNFGPFSFPDRFVLCDVYSASTSLTTGKKMGMPILYYKVRISLVAHDLADADNPQNMYKYQDNHDLVGLGKPWDPGGSQHTLFTDPLQFYRSTWNEMIQAVDKPYRADSFILISAGFDNEYGTPDDVFNFGE
jgi:type II secretory pathway pseudopilin PulG